jgi:hypothetical protein
MTLRHQKLHLVRYHLNSFLTRTSLFTPVRMVRRHRLDQTLLELSDCIRVLSLVDLELFPPIGWYSDQTRSMFIFKRLV